MSNSTTPKPKLTHEQRLQAAEKCECPIFLRKTYHMISSCDDEIAAWSEEGASFYVKQIQTFAKTILPQYFKHSNFSSFVRQLNFYGFTKTKDIKLTENPKTNYWEFQHSNFHRDNPERLVKIVRKINQKDGAGGKSDGKASVEKKEIKKEIGNLQGKLCSMEEKMKQLTNIMTVTKISAEGKVPDDVLENRGYTCMTKLNGTNKIAAAAKGGKTDASNTFLSKVQAQSQPQQQSRIAGSNKKQKILLKESQLFETKTTAKLDSELQKSGANTDLETINPGPTVLNNILDTLDMDIDFSNHLSDMSAASSVSLPSFAVSMHAASLDLPDLSAASDADLGVAIPNTNCSSAPANASTKMNMPSSRLDIDKCQGAPFAGSGGEPKPLDVTSSFMEVDQIMSCLENELSSPMRPEPALSSLQIGNSHPAIVLDDGHMHEKSVPTAPAMSLLPISKQGKGTNVNSNTSKQEKKLSAPARSRNLLDQNHLLNLEKCLALMPLQDRIKFVQDVMKNIGGLDDLLQKGLTIVAKTSAQTDTDLDRDGNHGHGISMTRQVVESGMDTSLLSELESLLLRVGLKIQLSEHSSSNKLANPNGSRHGPMRRNSGSHCARNSSRSSSVGKKKKDSSYVEIEA